MAAKTTGIEWCDSTWNPLLGCTECSPGCDHCWARAYARRFYPWLVGADGWWTGQVELRPDRLDQPLRWRKPRRVFACSQSDLFHPAVSEAQVAGVFGVMAAAKQHTFLVLTKRPERMLRWSGMLGEMVNQGQEARGCVRVADGLIDRDRVGAHFDLWVADGSKPSWPIPNLHLGVTCCNQQEADAKIPLLLQTPAAVRFVSIEPCLGPVDLSLYLALRNPDGPGYVGLDGVIIGGESGPGARPMEIAWARRLRDQCQAAEVPFFYKQGPGDHGCELRKLPMLDGRRWEEVPHA